MQVPVYMVFSISEKQQLANLSAWKHAERDVELLQSSKCSLRGGNLICLKGLKQTLTKKANSIFTAAVRIPSENWFDRKHEAIKKTIGEVCSQLVLPIKASTFSEPLHGKEDMENHEYESWLILNRQTDSLL